VDEYFDPTTISYLCPKKDLTVKKKDKKNLDSEEEYCDLHAPETNTMEEGAW